MPKLQWQHWAFLILAGVMMYALTSAEQPIVNKVAKRIVNWLS